MKVHSKLLHCVVGILAAGIVTTATAQTAAPVVKTGAGLLSGTADGGAVFRGIPYAQPPVGNLRWAPPQPVAHWAGTRAATSFGHPCAQANQGWNASDAEQGSEDCLYLNIFTPKVSTTTRLPVMVWIHGGGFTGGSGSNEGFAGTHFVEHGVVLVTLNYRLGVLGFFALPELTAAEPNAPGNFGLQDQIAALKWVKANIAAFGGDPGNVTMFGQSAGGGSVLDLMTSPLSNNLARQAIIESGAAPSGLMHTPKLAEAERVGTRFADGSSLAQLRSMPAASILMRAAELAKSGAQNQSGPIIDGHVLTDDPTAVFVHHGEHKIPLLIGNNAREGFGQIADQALPAAIRQAFGANADKALAFYGIGAATAAKPTADTPLGGVGAQFLTDTSFRCGAVLTALRHTGSGAPVWEYHFEQSIPGREAQGAAHSYELGYVFGNLSPDGFLGGRYGDGDRALASVMIRYWTDFAKTGNPNGAGVPEWPQFESSSRAFMRFSTSFKDDAMVDHRLRRDLCDWLGG